MRRRTDRPEKPSKNNERSTPLSRKAFHLEWKNSSQKVAYMAFEQNDMLFLYGPAGTSKTHLAVAFAVSEILSKKKKKIILTRPMVEAGEKLGFLPGSFEEKINPYLMPIFDCLDRIVGRDTIERNKVDQSMEIVPLAFMRGRTFHESVIILDEAQNCTEEQLKLAMTRLGLDSKMIINGDPGQSDLKCEVVFPKIIESMKGVQGIGMVEFNESHIVRHALVADILNAWPSK